MGIPCLQTLIDQKNENSFYGGTDCMKAFFAELKNPTIKIINSKHKVMILLTKKQEN